MPLDPSSLAGVIPPVITPLTPTRTFDRESFTRLIDHHIEQGIHGLFALGSTSEAPLLTNDMQDEVISAAVEHVGRRLPVLAGCIDFTTARVIERAQRAHDLGADGVVVCPPFYISPSAQEIVRHYETVREAVDLPILAYDIPSATQVKLQRPVIHQLASSGTIVALKDSSGMDANFRGAVLDNRDNQQFRIFTGGELTSDNALYMGAHGLVPGLGNVDAAGYVRLYEACVAEDWDTARTEQERLLRLFNIVHVAPVGEYGQSAAAHGAFKVAIWLQGLIDHPHTSPPHTPLTPEHHKAIAAILDVCNLPVTRKP